MHATVTKLSAERAAQARRKGNVLCLTLLCAALSAAVTLPFFFMAKREPGQSPWHLRMPATHDMSLHIYQMRAFDAGLRAHEIYPKWESDTNGGFGAPTTSFYPPGIYYLTSLIHLAFHDWVLGILVLEILSMMASGAAMYAYARRHMSPRAAALAMFMYLVLPYHLIDQYHRGALAELLGFIWMPLLLLFIEAVFGLRETSGNGGAFPKAASPEPAAIQGTAQARSDKLAPPSVRRVVPYAAGVAVTYAAFMWSHPPTAYQFSLILAIAIPWLAVTKRDWKGIVLCGSGLAAGVALAAAYIYPAAREKSLTTLDIISRIWPYQESYVFVHNTPFFPALINQTWVLNVAVIALCAIAAVFLGLVGTSHRGPSGPSGLSGPSGHRRPRGGAIALWIVAGCFASFMMTPLSHWVNHVIPMVETGIYSWRMLSITTLSAALLTGALADYVFNAPGRGLAQKPAKPRLMAYLTGFIALGSMSFSVVMVIGTTSPKPFELEPEHLNAAMLPKTALQDLNYLPRRFPEALLESPGGTLSVDRWNPEHRVITLDLPNQNRIALRTFNYPGWTASVDGQPGQIETGSLLGNIELELLAGRHRIVLDYVDTPARRRGRLISLCTWAAFILFLSIWKVFYGETKV